MNAPEWMYDAAKTNPIVNAYLRIWHGTKGMHELADLFERLAQDLAKSNEDLRKLAMGALTNAPPASICIPLAPAATFAIEELIAEVRRLRGVLEEIEGMSRDVAENEAAAYAAQALGHR